MRKPNLIWGVRLLFLTMLFGLMLPNAMAVSRDLTVAPKDIHTEKYYRDSPVCVCEVALLEGGKWVLSESFQDSNISQKVLFGENGSKYADQIYDYVMDKDLLYAVEHTDKQGKAVFSALDEGLYLVFSPDELFAPFLVELTESLSCEPKADPGKPQEPEPGPNPDGSESGDDSSTPPWHKPAKTGDDTPVDLYRSLLCVGTVGLTTLEAIRRRGRKNTD